MKLNFTIAKPAHGWLPITLKWEDFELAFEASDVPNNCIDELMTALQLVMNGIASEVEFHLEPAWYVFKFSNAGTLYHLVLSKKSNGKIHSLTTIKGSFEEIIMPFYRALKKMYHYKIEEIDWPNLREQSLVNLTTLIEAKKRKSKD